MKCRLANIKGRFEITQVFKSGINWNEKCVSPWSVKQIKLFHRSNLAGEIPVKTTNIYCLRSFLFGKKK